MNLALGVFVLVTSFALFVDAKRRNYTHLTWIGLGCIGISLIFDFFHVEWWRFTFAVAGIVVSLVGMTIRFKKGQW